MLCLLRAPELKRDIPHNKSERDYACLLKGEEFRTRGSRGTFNIYTNLGDKPPPTKRRRQTAPENVRAKKPPSDPPVPFVLPGIEDDGESEKELEQESDAPDSSRNPPSSSSKASSRNATSRASSDSDSSSKDSSVLVEPAGRVVPEPELAPQPLHGGGGGGGGGGKTADATILWKTFKFTEIKDRDLEVVGIEVSCYIEAHKRKGPRCSRTLRFRKHCGRVATVQKLMWWCTRGLDAQVCTNCTTHQAEPNVPPSWLPKVEDVLLLKKNALVFLTW